MKRLATIPLVTLLLLVPALPAAARHGDRAPHDDRHPVLNSAIELEGLTRRLLRHARHDTWHPRRSERRALRELRKLRREARAFRDAAESGRRLRGLARDFDEVEQSFADAAERFRGLHPDRALRRDFRRVARAVSRLDRQLDPRRLSRGRHSRRARHEVAQRHPHHRHREARRR